MQISEHVHAVKIPFDLRNRAGEKVIDRFVYVFLIYGQRIYLIDTGVAFSEQLTFDYIRKTGRRPDEMSKIMVTHSHPDHIGALKAIKELIACPVIAHGAERDWIENIDKQFAERPIANFYTLMGGSVQVDETIDEGDVIRLDDDDSLNLRVFHTPGHSRGSSSYYLEADKVLVVGDAIPVPGDLPIYDDPWTSVESIKKLMRVREANTLLSSWAEPIFGDKVRTAMEQGANYIKRLHELVVEIVNDDPLIDTVAMCQRVLESVNIPAKMALPLVVRSLAASLPHKDRVF